MNKKVNTLLFVLAGTIVNILLMLGLFILFLFLGNLVLTPETDSAIKLLVFLVIIGLSVVGSFLIYSRIVNFIIKRWKLEEIMHPVISRRKKK